MCTSTNRETTKMGLGSFRVRVVAALLIVIVVWQVLSIWSPTFDNSSRNFKEQVNDLKKIQIGAAGPNEDLQKVQISVYYEALCPDSRGFVVNQLEPTVKTLKDRVVLEMIPYGKATTEKTGDDYKFTCQHGPPECEANIIHSCAIDILKDRTVQLEYLSCMIKNNFEPEAIAKSCADKMKIDVDPILKCSKESKGKELFAMYGEMTNALRPKVSFIPTIALNQDLDNQPAILKNLLKEVCLCFKELPEGCPQYR